jgi:hypothetical protein
MGGEDLLRRLGSPRGLPVWATNSIPTRCRWAWRTSTRRAELESKGVIFVGDTLDTGVCHMVSADPDGNQLMFHRRDAPYGNA